jgi:hypothetical protein
VDWTPTHALPARIEEAIDYNGDGTADFRVTWTKGMEEAELVPLSPAVTGLAGCYQLKNALAVRVNLRR